MPSVMTIDGARGKGGKCKTVRSGKRGCTIKLCKTGKRWKFKKGTFRCSR